MEKSDAKQKVSSLLKKKDVIGIAENLISIPSLTGQEKDIVMFVKNLLDREGFDTILQEVEPGRPQIIAFIRGDKKGESLMLNGHLDIDPIKELWKGDPFKPRIEGNRLWGAGIHNMKSGVAAMLSAAIAVKKSKINLSGDLVVACVVGELQGGKGTVHMLKSGIKTDYAIVPEPYSIGNIITKSVGVHKFSITTIGKSIHISRKEKGIDALEKMLKVIEALKRLDLGVKDPDFPGVPRYVIGSIIGGHNRSYDLGGACYLPDVCTIIADLRYPEGITPRGIDEKIVQMLEEIRKKDKDFKYEYEHPPNQKFKVGGTDMPPMNVSTDIELVKIIRSNHQHITGKKIGKVGAVVPYSYCGNDTAHLQRAGIECCLYGPRGYPNGVEEHVRIDEMADCARVLAGCIIDICT